MPADLSVVIVNYNSATYVGPLMESLHADSFLVDGRKGTLEVVIVDNASRNEDHALLERLAARRNVRLVRNTENVGYALANQQGFHVSEGRYHIVSNPDVLVRTGCLQALLDALNTLPDAGIVGPLASMDVEGRVLMPPNELPDLYTESLVLLSRYEDAVCRYHVKRRARFAHAYWTADRPIALPMLSGGFFLGRRQTFEDHGLFDPGYPLYYEDTDLFRRYGTAGLRLWHVPSARIVHHFSRSAIPRMKAAMHRHEVGARRYFEKFFGPTGFRVWLAARARAQTLADDAACPYPLTEVPPSFSPPSVDVPEHQGAFLEVAGNPKFSLAVGIFPPGPGSFRVPETFWNQLPLTHYWCRAVDPATGGTLRAWRLTRCPET